jgi:hypothetical protein
MAALTHARQPLEIRLDVQSGVPVYRQIIDQIMGGIATGAVKGGDQLPTVGGGPGDQSEHGDPRLPRA